METIYEELYLLALDEDKGNFFQFVRKSLPYTLAGVILAELALLGKVSLSEKLRLVVSESTPTNEPVLDGVLEKIRVIEKPRKVTYWVSLLSEEPKKLRQVIGERLVAKNFLVQDEKRFLRQESVTDSAITIPSRFQIKNQLRALVLANGESNLHSLTILKMIAAGGLLNLVFTQDEIETANWIINKRFMSAALEFPSMQVVEEIAQAVRSVWEDEME
jgi:Golgi phosphoprotein 3